MSQNNQIVYFNNPTSITSLQSNVGLDTVLNTAKITTSIPTYAKTFLVATTGTGNSQDAKGQNCFSYVGMVGNAFSGQVVFYATGPAKIEGGQTAWDPEVTVYNSTSGGKLFQSICLLKLIEEGWVDPSATVKTYIPFFSGNYYYYTGACTGTFIPSSITGTYPGAMLFDGSWPGISAWTGSVATDSLDTITVRDAMSLNIGFPADTTWAYPRNIKDWAEAPTKGNVDWRVLCSHARNYEAGWRGYNLGTPGAAYADPKALWTVRHPELLGLNDAVSYTTGPAADYLYSCVKLLKNGTVPMAWKVGEAEISGNNIYQVKGLYSALSYYIIGAVANKGAIAAGYASFTDYFRQKFLTPMGITPSQAWCEKMEPPPANYQLIKAEQQFRRTQQMCTGYLSAGCDPQMLIDGNQWISTSGTGGRPFNWVFWASQYPNDKIAAAYQPNYYAGWDQTLGQTFGGAYYVTLNAWKKVYSMFINKGVYNGVRYLSRAIWNYGQITAVPAGAAFYQYGNYPSLSNNNFNWTISQGFQLTEGPTSELYIPSDYDPDQATTASVPGMNIDNSLYWSGAFGNAYYIDYDTGIYIFQINHVSSYGNRAKSVNATALLPYSISLP